MNKKLLESVTIFILIVGVMGIFCSYLVYGITTMPDSDPPIEDIDYQRATMCTLSILIPAIIMAAIGTWGLLKLKKEKISKPPTQ